MNKISPGQATMIAIFLIIVAWVVFVVGGAVSVLVPVIRSNGSVCVVVIAVFMAAVFAYSAKG